MLSPEAVAMDHLRSMVPGAITAEVEAKLQDAAWVTVVRDMDEVGFISLPGNTDLNLVAGVNGMGKSRQPLYKTLGLFLAREDLREPVIEEA